MPIVANLMLKRSHHLQVVPFLPFLFDKPVEQAVDYVFEKIEDRIRANNKGNPLPPPAPREGL